MRAQAELLKRQEELERKAAELDRREREMQSLSASGGELSLLTCTLKACMCHSCSKCFITFCTHRVWIKTNFILTVVRCDDAECSIILTNLLNHFLSVCPFLLSKGGKTTGHPSQRSFPWDHVSIMTYQWTSQWSIRKPLRSCTISGCVSNS